MSLISYTIFEGGWTKGLPVNAYFFSQNTDVFWCRIYFLNKTTNSLVYRDYLRVDGFLSNISR